MLETTLDLAGPVAHTMVGWLGTYLVHSSALIGGVWAFSRCLTLDALTRSFLWKVSLVGGLFTASFQTGLGHQPWLGSLAIAGDTVAAPPPVPPAPPPPPPHMQPCDGCGGDLLVIVDGDDGTTVVAMPGFAGFDLAPSPPATATVADLDFPVYLTGAPVLGLPAATVGPALAPAVPAPRDRAALLALAGLFLTGAAVSLTRLGLTARRLRRTLRSRFDLMDGPLRDRFDHLMERARIPLRQVRLTMSPALASPLALAGREIVVPERAEELRPHQQEAMLAHELAHVVRRDPSWQILASALEALMWIQPLHRVARRGMQEAAEELSDDWAVRHTGNGLHLARCLAEVATWPAPEDSSLASPMAAGGKLLVRRVQRLLDVRERERGRWARRWRGLLGAALLAVVGLAAPDVSFARPGEPATVPDVPDVPPTPVLAHVPDHLGPRLAFAGPGEHPPMLALAHDPHDRDHVDHLVVIDEENQLSARQRRLLRRAARLDRRAEELRDRSSIRHHQAALEIHHPHHVHRVHLPPPPQAPQPPAPPSPPHPPHVRVIHPHVPQIDLEALERDIEAAAEVAAEAAEVAAEVAAGAEAAAVVAHAFAPEQVRRIEQQARDLSRRFGRIDGLEHLDEDIQREVDEALRDAARELRQAQHHMSFGPSPEQLRKLGEAARAAEALRAAGEDAEDDADDIADHEELRRAIEEARRAGVRVIDQAELRRIKEAARAAAARAKADRKRERDAAKDRAKQK